MPAPGRIVSRVVVTALFVLAVSMFATVVLAKGEVALKATIDGRDVSVSSDANPIVLDPEGAPVLRVRVENNGDSAIQIKTVRLNGNVIGLTFFAYDTSVGMRIEPGEVEERAFEMDLVGLTGQAVGLIPSSVEILDPDRNSLAAVSQVVDVRGSLRSVYGIFGMAIVALTLTSLGVGLVKLARHTLPPNRWKRGMRFTAPGVGAGLTAVFTLSALRIFAPSADKWIPLLVGGGLVGFVLGYLTPSPVTDEEEDEEEEDEEDVDAATRPTFKETQRLDGS